MAFTDVEKQEYFHPFEVYEFVRDTFNWRFTSGDVDVTVDAKTYTAVPLKRTQIESTQDIGKNTLKITVSRNNELATEFIKNSPTDVINLTVTRVHDVDASVQAVTFKGRIINVSFKEDSAIITCQSNLSSLRRPGLRRLYQTACPHVLYGTECKVVKSSFKITATLDAVDGVLLTSTSFIISIDPEFDSTWLVGGVLEFVDSNSLVTKRFIVNHDSALGTIRVNLPIEEAIVTSSVDVFPGCDHTPETCEGKFSIIENYGGFPFIPLKNPMDGTPVF